MDQIQKSYFDGQPILFPDNAKDLADIINDAEKTVANFNEAFVDGMAPDKRIDLKSLHQSANQQANRVRAYIVDVAKAEALDCIGDEKIGVKIIERYL